MVAACLGFILMCTRRSVGRSVGRCTEAAELAQMEDSHDVTRAPLSEGTTAYIIVIDLGQGDEETEGGRWLVMKLQDFFQVHNVWMQSLGGEAGEFEEEGLSGSEEGEDDHGRSGDGHADGGVGLGVGFVGAHLGGADAVGGAAHGEAPGLWVGDLAGVEDRGAEGRAEDARDDDDGEGRRRVAAEGREDGHGQGRRDAARQERQLRVVGEV
mmetsp:Transcript_36468/g.116889  ORF Transcript_36468/g.116889 Transcript_36468/m.116889 type:complete len:212 (+) Transcript_36468:1139-1774(+)